MRAIEADLERQIDKKLGLQGTSAKCPPNVSWRVGDSFFCEVVTPDSAAGFAEVTRIADSRGYSWYISNTCRDEKRKLGYQKPECVTPTPLHQGEGRARSERQSFRRQSAGSRARSAKVRPV